MSTGERPQRWRVYATEWKGLSLRAMYSGCTKGLSFLRDVFVRYLSKPRTSPSFIPLIGTCTLRPHVLTLSLLFLTYPSHPHPTPKNALTSHWSAPLSGCSMSFPPYLRTWKIGPIYWSTWPEGLTRPLVKPSPTLLLKLSSVQKPSRSDR